MANRKPRSFEWALLIILIAAVAVVAFNFYARLAGDAQRLGFELTAQNFQTAVSAIRAQWYVQCSRNEPAEDVVVFSELPGAPGSSGTGDPVRVYLNARGWPASTGSRTQALRPMTEAACVQLWQGLLQNPPPIGLEDDPITAPYRASLADQGQCRYRQADGAQSRRYFDYWPDSGRVTVHSP